MSRSNDSLTNEYRELWKQTDTPSVKSFVQSRNIAAANLADLLVLDQSLRWKSKMPIQLEDYFLQFPAILDDTELAIDLVFSEFLLQQQADLEPSLDEYARRFPQLAVELRRQVAFHRAIGSFESENQPAGIDSSTSTSDAPVTKTEVAGAPDVAGYQIVAELGRGGTGIVYQAVDLQLHRPVALKMLLRGQFSSPHQLQRFLREAEATARLQHPNIVQIYEVGLHENNPYLAIEFINDGKLSDWSRGEPQPPRAAAEVIKTLAEAVHFAHLQGVVHRDLKPQNVLIHRTATSLDGVSDKGQTLQPVPLHCEMESVVENPARRRPNQVKNEFEQLIAHSYQLKIVDFGMAKLEFDRPVPEHDPITVSGELFGTVAYMSPEQAQGSGQLTFATDVFSLGVMLYELLTGRPPFVGVKPFEVIAHLIADDPIRPSQIVRRLPNDMQTICLKCLQKSPGRRYVSAQELAKDLGRFLNGQPILARQTSSIERSWKWCRRNPANSILVASVMSFLILVAAISSWYSVQLRQQLDLTSAANRRERSAKTQMLTQLWESQLAQADAMRLSSQVGQRYDALQALSVARELGNSMDTTDQQVERLRNTTIACLAQPDMHFSASWPRDESQVGSVVAVDHRQSKYAYLSSNNQIVVREMITGKKIVEVPVTSMAASFFFSTDGQKLAIINDVCRVYSIDDHPDLVFQQASEGAWDFSLDGKRMLGISGGRLCLFDLSNSKILQTFDRIQNAKEVLISPDSRRAAIFDGQTVYVIELKTGTVHLKIDQPNIPGQKHFAWHPSSRFLAIGPVASQEIQFWDIDNGTRLNSLPSNTGELELIFNSTGEQLLTYDVWSGNLSLFNINSGKISLSQIGNVHAAITADDVGGFRLLQLIEHAIFNAASIDYSDIYATLPLIHSRLSGSFANSFEYSPDGRMLAVVNHGDLEIYETQKYQELDHLACGYCYIQFQPDGSLVSATEFGMAKWKLHSLKGLNFQHDVKTGDEYQLGPPEYLSDSVAYSQFAISFDGATMAIPTGSEFLVQTSESASGFRSIGPHSDIRRLAINPNGRQVVTGGWDGGKACVWDISTGKLLHTFAEPICCLVDYSPDGKWLVTNADRVRLWDASSFKHVADIPVNGISVNGVQTCFSPDSRILAVSDSLARINLIDPQSGETLLVLTDPNQDRAVQLAFDPAGTHLAVLSESRGTVLHVWDLTAIRFELCRRELDSEADNAWSKKSNSNERSVAYNAEVLSVRFVPDQPFKEIEAQQQFARLQRAVESNDIISAQASIARLRDLQPQTASTCNELAWLLATGPQPLRDSALAVQFARRAYDDKSVAEPDHKLYVNTLGVALYRDDQIKDALKLLNESLAIQKPENQPFDLYFISMCQSRLGDSDAAHKQFELAQSLVKKFASKFSTGQLHELSQLADEAKTLIH